MFYLISFPRWEQNLPINSRQKSQPVHSLIIVNSPAHHQKQDPSDHEKVTTIKNVCNFSPECPGWAKWSWQGLWWLSWLSSHNNPSNKSHRHTAVWLQALLAVRIFDPINFAILVMYWSAKWYVKPDRFIPAVLTLWSIPIYCWRLISIFHILMKYVGI